MTDAAAMMGAAVDPQVETGSGDRKLQDAMTRGRETLGAAFAVMGRNQTKDLKDPTAYELCLTPFLDAVGWVGEDRRLIQALPHFDPVETMDEFRMVLASLGVRTSVQKLRLDKLSDDQLPCVLEIDGAPAVARRRLANGALQTLDGAAGEVGELQPSARMATICYPTDPLEPPSDAATVGWFSIAFSQFRREIGFLLALTLAANVLALSTPLFSMAIYNLVAPSRETSTLIFLVAAIIAALVFEDFVRGLRTRTMATSAARLHATIQRETFARILALPLSMTLSASVSAQSARLKQFEAVFGVFNGGLAAALLDLPFTLVFFIAIAVVGGPLAIVPILVLLLFAAAAAIAIPMTRANSSLAGRRRSEAQEIAWQTIADADTIRGLGAERIWIRRASAAALRAAKARHRAASFNQTLQAGAQFLTASAGVATLLVGATLVISGDLTTGALIASMMLIWRMMGPVQTVVLAGHQLLAAYAAVKQINKLMAMANEERDVGSATVYRNYKGAIRAENLTFKYSRAAEFAIRGVSFNIEAGQMVAVAGLSGAGKSTLLKLLLGLHKPVGGGVFIDGLNLAQLDPTEVRSVFSFGPERAQFFFGTVAQNIRLAKPTATNEEIAEVLTSLGLEPGGPNLPQGLETRLSGQGSSGLTDGAIQLIAMARALIKPSPIYLLDSPTELLDPSEFVRMRDRIATLKGRSTMVVITTHHEIIEMCDRVMVLQAGQLAADLPPKDFFERVKQNAARSNGGAPG